MPLPSWLYLARSLDTAGERARAYEVLDQAVREGEILALVAMAQLKWKHGSFYEAGEMMKSAERQVTAQNGEVHFAMHIAYSSGVGHGEYEERQQLAFEHLLAAARESDDPRMKYSVGLHYWNGLNGVEKDRESAERWLSQAAKSGDAEFVSAYKRFTRTTRGRNKSAT